MKIKTKLQIAAILPILLSLFVGLVFFLTEQKIEKGRKNSNIADAIAQKIFNLNQVTHYYLLYHEERPEKQFQLILDSLVEPLSEIRPLNSEEETLLQRLRENNGHAKALFLNLVELHEKKNAGSQVAFPMELEQRVAGQLLMVMREMGIDSLRLNHLSGDQVEVAHKRARLFIVISSVTLAVFMLFISLMLGRSVIKRVLTLQEGMAVISSGNLDHRVPVEERDEIGQLSEGFNEMTGRLRTSYASIEDLQRVEKALRESEQRWATTLASIGDAVISADVEGNIMFMNAIAEQLTGWTIGEAAMKPATVVFNIINEQTRKQVESPITKVLREGMVVGLANHTILVRKDGTEVPIDDSGAPIRDREGKTSGVVLVFHDITERKKAEVLLQRQAELLHLSYDAIIVWRLGGRIESWNKGAEDLYGYSQEEAIGHVTHDLLKTIHPEPWSQIEAKLRELKFWEGELKHRTRDGQDVIVSARLQLIQDADGVERILETNRDITERKQGEEALQQRTLELQHLTETLEERVKERTAELATLSSELLVAQEKERRRISYNLHDNVWQTLEIIRVQLEHLFSREDNADWLELHRKSKQLTPVIRDTIARVRSMQGDLWPSVLDDIGIVATLEWYCREFGINHPGLGVEKNVGLAEEEVPASAKIVIYRVMQEALSNVVKHSQASHVSLSLIKSDHRFEFNIMDNGVGFDPEEAIVKRNPWGGLGLRSMKERTELSGGLFGIESAKGKGTTIRVSWPLNDSR